MIWELVTRLGGQMRVASTMGGAVVMGWDMVAALALGRAMGLPEWLVAEMLPEIEAAMVSTKAKGGSDGG
jgi:hypothetical protein